MDTPGDAKAVACSCSVVAVADGQAGLAVVDVSAPANARILRTINLRGPAQAVAIRDNVAFVGLSSGVLASVDLLSGTVLEQVQSESSVDDLVIEGRTLFCLLGRELRAYDLSGGSLQLLGVAIRAKFHAEGITRRRRLFIGGGFAYATSYPGYDTFDISDPTAIRQTGAAVDGGQNSFKQIVTTGSGLGVAAVGTNPRPDGTHDINLYDVSDPSDTTRYLTTLPTPGVAHALTIYNGLAYVADGEAGLQVVNYLAADTRGIAPLISLTADFPLRPPRAESGRIVRVTVNAADDVQVRNVELYVDGAKIATDGNFPFDFRFVTPPRSAAKTSLLLQAKATDTGAMQPGRRSSLSRSPPMGRPACSRSQPARRRSSGDDRIRAI